MTNHKRLKQIQHGLVYLLLSIGAVIMIMPFLWMFFTSFKTMAEVFSFDLNILPKKFSWQNYQLVWSVLPFGQFYLNSILVSACVTIGQVVLCSLAAYAFARLQFPGRDKLFLLYLAALMIPSQITLVPNYIAVKYLHLADSLAGVILPQLFSVFGTFLLRQFFLTIPRELEDAAKIDGCTHFGIYLRVILPLSGMAITTLGLFGFMFSWNSFLWPLIVINSTAKFTVPLGLVSFQGQFTTNWPVMMAAACQAMLPVIIVYLFAQKYFIEGVSMQGLGGR